MLEINLEISKIINQYEEMLEKLFTYSFKMVHIDFCKIACFQTCQSERKVPFKVEYITN